MVHKPKAGLAKPLKNIDLTGNRTPRRSVDFRRERPGYKIKLLRQEYHSLAERPLWVDKRQFKFCQPQPHDPHQRETRKNFSGCG